MNYVISGGSFKKKEVVKDHAPKNIKNSIVSVRAQKTGKGSGLRVFVDSDKKLCFFDRCLSKYSTLSVEDKVTAWCDHLKEAQQATETAKQINVTVESLSDLNLDKDIMAKVKSQCVDGLITCYEVNAHTIVTPTFASISASGVIGLTHVKDLVCKLKDCKAVKTQHALAKRTEKICLHNLVVMKCGVVHEKKVTKQVINKIDHIKTIDTLMEKVDSQFPSLNEEALKDFLPKNKSFVDNLRYYIISNSSVWNVTRRTLFFNTPSNQKHMYR